MEYLAYVCFSIPYMPLRRAVTLSLDGQSTCLSTILAIIPYWLKIRCVYLHGVTCS